MAAEWIAAVGTAGATLLAGGALALQQRDRRRQVAESITGWLTLGEQEPIVFQLLNSSSVPVYNVVAVAVFDKEQTRVGSVAAEQVLPPGQHGKQEDELYDPDHTDAPAVVLMFRDPAGRAWRRDAAGRLKRLRDYDGEREFVQAHATMLEQRR